MASGTVIAARNYDEERALYHLTDAVVRDCSFAGPADGESVLKECRNITVENCRFSLRYPLWHAQNFLLTASELDENMIRFLREADLPFVVALTKADKLSRQQQMKQKAALKRQLALGDDASMVVTSSAKGDGIEELRKIIRDAVA